jgi:3-hydroxyisobutyrate dehydrogenase-like beta-hydroxyacid dehydrogenase
MTTVAVAGLGGMGSRMARRLVEAGHHVVVWNRTPAKAAELVELGAQQADSPADAARQAEVVLTMLADPEALRAVVEGADGIAAEAGEGVTVIEMSTVGPAAIQRLRSSLPEGTGLLDAPVLGSLLEVEAGSLRIFVGGPEPLVERWTPLLSELGTPHHVGPLGSGAAAKLVVNSTLFGVLGVLGEAVALGRGLGLTPEATFDVIASTPVAAQAERRREAIESGDYPRRFSLSLAVKDAALVAEAAAGAARGRRGRLGRPGLRGGPRLDARAALSRAQKSLCGCSRGSGSGKRLSPTPSSSPVTGWRAKRAASCLK